MIRHSTLWTFGDLDATVTYLTYDLTGDGVHIESVKLADGTDIVRALPDRIINDIEAFCAEELLAA